MSRAGRNHGLHQTRLGSVAAAALAVGLLTAGGCTSDSDKIASVFTANDLTCDRDPGSPQAQDTIERVGGLRTSDYRVQFAMSTRLGAVALVVGDFDKASRELTRKYDAALIAEFEDDGSGRKVTGFEQVRNLVDKTCGPTGS